MGNPWLLEEEERAVLQAAILALLSLARPFGMAGRDERSQRARSLLVGEAGEEEFSYDDCLLASRSELAAFRMPQIF